MDMGNFFLFSVFFFISFLFQMRPSPPMYEFVSREKSTQVWQRQHRMNVLGLDNDGKKNNRLPTKCYDECCVCVLSCERNNIL